MDLTTLFAQNKHLFRYYDQIFIRRVTNPSCRVETCLFKIKKPPLGASPKKAAGIEVTRFGEYNCNPASYSLFLYSREAPMNALKSGCGTSGLDLNSGWNWHARN